MVVVVEVVVVTTLRCGWEVAEEEKVDEEDVEAGEGEEAEEAGEEGLLGGV